MMPDHLPLLWRTTQRVLADPALRAPTTRTLGSLLALACQPDVLTISDLALALNSSMPATSKCVAALEMQGLVERFTNPANGREVFVRLTEQGNAVIRRITQP